MKKDKKIKILMILGTRPEGIKLAPVIKRLDCEKDNFSYEVCSTGQHREMLKQVMDFFEIRPDYNLNLMTANQSLESLSSKIIVEIAKILKISGPDIVLIQGDTTTAFLTALSAFYQKIKVGHVEAGLRTYDKFGPFPEEMNRQLISRVADLHFVPTITSYNNLLSENIDKDNMLVCGNTIVDAIIWGIKKIKSNSKAIEKNTPFNLIDRGKKLLLLTMHRRESFGRDLENVCKAIRKIANTYNNIQIIYPVHPNPNVLIPVQKILGDVNNVILTSPLGYKEFIWLMSLSYFIITDSGGVQEEAPTLRKPVLVIRKKTERTESLDMGISRLVGTSIENIVNNVIDLLDNVSSYRNMISNKNPYGDGKSSEKIIDFIYEKLKR